MGAIAWTMEYQICTAPEPFDTLVTGLPPPTGGVGIFTVKMPFFSGKTAENVMGVYGFDCPAIF